MKAEVWNFLFLVRLTRVLHLLTDTDVPFAEMAGTCSHYETRAGHQQRLTALCKTVILPGCVCVCVCASAHTCGILTSLFQLFVCCVTEWDVTVYE